MSWILFRAAVTAGAVFGLVACDRLSLGPPTAEPAAIAPALPAEPVVDPQLRSHAGEAYADFVSSPAGASFGPEALGLIDGERTRLMRAMVTPGLSEVLNGGGAEALVFRGCAETGCADGVAIVAVDLERGTAFVGIKDADGAEILAPNDRVEALLRLNSPTRTWDNPEAPAESASP